MVKKEKYDTLVAVSLLILEGCGEAHLDGGISGDPWSSTPDGIQSFGDGYPNSGAPCRRLAETQLTVDWLDHTAALVGCPGSEESIAAQSLVRGRQGVVVAVVEGFTIISVPE